MEISINNEAKTVEPNTTVGELLRMFVTENPKGIAVAVNEQVIPRGDWENVCLRKNDSVLLITATQGG